MTVSQIIPATNGSFGVEDYAKRLASAWCGQVFASSSVFSLSPRSGGTDLALKSLDQNSCLQAVILHYSGYGYAKRGTPFWLTRSLGCFRRRFPLVPVITMFHEVSASGPVTSSAFWLTPVQRYLARRLRILSDMVLTNCAANARELDNFSGPNSRNVFILPVFSNFGENSGMPCSERKRRMVIFNSNFGGQVPNASFWQELGTAVAVVKATEVIMIGRPLIVPLDLNFPVIQPGFLDAAEVSEILATSSFGYVFHGLLLLGKSGIFAAFAAHGIVPLIPTVLARLPDGLIEGKHYHSIYHSLSDGEENARFEQIRCNILEWYRPHNIAATAEVYASLLDKHH